MQSALNVKTKATNKMLFILGVLIFSYTFTRACLLSITWDEAYSYLEFIRKGIIIPHDYNRMSANNHLLNTWLNIFLTKYFGTNEFVLRLPSLFAHILFLFFSYRLVKIFQNSWLAIASFLIINLNPYILDFFSLSRGYGLSLGLMVVSIYYLYVFLLEEEKYKHALLSVFFSLLAVLANFVLLNYCLILLGIFLFLIFQNNRKQHQGTPSLLLKTSVLLVVAILFLFFVIPVVFHLREAGALFYGGNTGVWTDTISETINRNFYELNYTVLLHWLTKAFLSLIILCSATFVCYNYSKKRITANSLFLGCLLLLSTLPVFANTLQHNLFGTPFLTNRTALFLIVLFNLILVFFIEELSKKKKKAVVVIYLSAVIAVCHFIFSFNLNHCADWKFDADTKTMLSELEKIEQSERVKKNIKIGVSPVLSEGIEFYIETNNWSWLSVAPKNDKDSVSYDYLYLSKEEFEKQENKTIEIVKRYETTQNVLCKNGLPLFP